MEGAVCNYSPIKSASITGYKVILLGIKRDRQGLQLFQIVVAKAK